jgi:trk system potassium uptake protein TrkH
MNFRGIIFYLGLSCFPIAFLSFFNILYASYFDYYLSLDSYILTLFASLIFGVLFYYFGKSVDKDIKFFEQLILIFLTYVFISLLISIPYYFSIYQLTFINSYFESVSGLTTTGFTIFSNIKYYDPTLILWRSSSQWIGGFFFLIFLVLIFSNFKNEYKLTHIVYNPDKTNNLYKDINSVVIKIFFIYLSLSAIIFILLSLSGVRLFNGLNLAMTISSTGGFLPTDELKDIIKTNPQKIVLIFTLLISVLNIYFFYSLFSKMGIRKKHQEDLMILTSILLFSLILLISIDSAGLIEIVSSVISSISTSGISIYEPPKNFNLFFVFLTIIGGSTLSNSSGLKFLRFYILLKSSILEIVKLVTPNIIIDQRILKTENKINTENINSSFLVFISFFISILILSSFLSSGNLNFEKSFKLSILTLTNTVNSELQGLETISFSSLLTSSKTAIILFMIIGKIELISFFLIIKKIFFKN